MPSKPSLALVDPPQDSQDPPGGLQGLSGTPEALPELSDLLEAPGGRRRLPDERIGWTHKVWLYGTDGKVYRGYLTVGLYPDGQVGEVFLKTSHQGSTVSGFMDAWAVAVSLLLQTGTPLEVVCRKFMHMRFEPQGRTPTPGIRSVSSLIDYAARVLHRRYVEKLPFED